MSMKAVSNESSESTPEMLTKSRQTGIEIPYWGGMGRNRMKFSSVLGQPGLKHEWNLCGEV